jgi:hypothetical protein
MQVMQAELIDQGLLDFLMQDEKAVGLDAAAAQPKRARHVAVDIDRLAVEAIASEIRNIVRAVELSDPPHHGVKRAIHHQARDIPFRQSKPLVRRRRVAKIERHRLTPTGRSVSRPYR